MTDTVLVVDDSLTVRMDLEEAFAAAGFHAVLCSSAAEARAALERTAAGVVVLDVLLPDADGVELLKEIRASPASASAVVLLLSSEAEVRDRIRGLRTGADEYVGKPYDRAYVVAKARELVRSRRPEGAREETKILVIDDSVTFREELRSALLAAGYAVATAESGEEGLRLAASEKPGAVIVDGALPGIDGATVVRHLRLDAALRGVPCVLLTASEDRDAEVRALDSGADAFVRKEEEIGVILARLAAALRQARSGPAAEPGSLLGPKRILAVDDSLTYLHELADALRGEGYDVVLARSGEQALELLAVQPVDCILLDLLMPGLGGQETCRRIKAAPVVRDIPLVMLTALEDREAMIAGLGAGADDYIPKSSEFGVLKARVRAQLRRKQFEDENRRIRDELLRKDLEAAEARAAREVAETRAAFAGELEQKNKELESFSYTVSHDLRAPLRAITGYVQILEEEYDARLDDEGKRLLGVVRSSARRMGQLIDDLLEFSRLGRRSLVIAPLRMQALVSEVLDELAASATRARIETGDLPDARADRALLRQVWMNLIGNALKYSSKQAAPRIEIGGRTDGRERVYWVRDNGVGFDMRYYGKLFGVFQRLHGEEEFPGTGVGLAIVQRVVGRHGGRVWAEAKPGEGACFWFALPADPAAPG
jgi:DNA-binding response OmpR family regulator